MEYPKSWTGPWTLDSGLWTFPSQNFIPPPKKKPLYLPPKKLPPQKNFPPNNKYNYIGFLIESD